MMDNIFSLLDEPWVQVIYKDGRPAEIPLRQVFSDAANIKELSGDIPQQKFPLIRLFLAILYRASFKFLIWNMRVRNLTLRFQR